MTDYRTKTATPRKARRVIRTVRQPSSSQEDRSSSSTVDAASTNGAGAAVDTQFSSLSICIVGHGRSPENKAWAEKIDSCDYVIRMWNWDWQDQADYGKRYDYGFLEASPDIIVSFYKYNRRQPRRGWVVSDLFRSQMCQLPRRSELIDQTRWCDIGKSLGGLGATGRLQFTRGTIAACWAIENAHPGDEIILVGFDNVYAGEALTISDGFSPAYVEAPGGLSFSGYKPGRKYGNHDFAIEQPVLEHLAAKHRVNLRFAQDIW